MYSIAVENRYVPVGQQEMKAGAKTAYCPLLTAY
jgi:hypothetical protein